MRGTRDGARLMHVITETERNDFSVMMKLICHCHWMSSELAAVTQGTALCMMQSCNMMQLLPTYV